MDKVASQKEYLISDYADAMVVARGQGWYLMSTLLTRDQSKALREEALHLAGTPERHPECKYFYNTSTDGERRLARVEHVWENLPSLGGPLGESFRRLAEVYLEGPVILFKDKINFRYPNSDGYSPHQDAAAGWIEFADRFVSLSPFLGPSNFSRGGFEIAGHCHRSGRFENENGRMRDTMFLDLDPFELRAEEGDLLLLDGETPHRTGRNGAESLALHLLFTFVPARFKDARESYFNSKFSRFSPTGHPNTYEFRVFKF